MNIWALILLPEQIYQNKKSSRYERPRSCLSLKNKFVNNLLNTLSKLDITDINNKGQIKLETYEKMKIAINLKCESPE